MKLKKIACTLDNLVKNMNHSGSILISTDQEIIYEKYFGFSNLKKRIPVSSKTQFLAGSVTKQFTAVAILKALLDKYKKDIQSKLNKPISYYLNKKNKIWDGDMPSWANNITLHQLLVHSSGIPNYTSLPDFENKEFKTKKELVTFFKEYPLEFNPGDKFAYSNSGYYLLGIIIEEIIQENLDIYLEKTFFKPIGMQATFLPRNGTVDELINTDARFLNLARGYQYDVTTLDANLEEIKRYDRMEVPFAAGSLITTTEDLLKWNNALYDGKIIPQFLLELMLHPYLVTERMEAYYGYGIEIMNSKVLGIYYSHRGGISGFRSILTYIPSFHLSLITMQNLVSDQEKIMPEIKETLASFPSDLSKEEMMKKLAEIFETKYPAIIENRKRFELAPIYEEAIKAIDDICK